MYPLTTLHTKLNLPHSPAADPTWVSITFRQATLCDADVVVVQARLENWGGRDGDGREDKLGTVEDWMGWTNSSFF